MKNGRLINESLSTRSFETAKAVVTEIERCVLQGIDWHKSPELFDDAWGDFLKAKAAGNKTKKVREKTLREYIQFGNRFLLPHLKNERLATINDVSWEQLVAEIRREKPDMLFFNLRKYFSGFMAWCKRHGKITEMPYLFDPDLEHKERLEQSKAELNIYTVEQLAKLREAASKHDKFLVFMLMAQYMGMRPSEITQLKKDRIDWERKVIKLKGVDTKTHKARMVPIHPNIEAGLRSLVESSGSPYVFPNRVDSKRPMDRTGFKGVWDKILAEAQVEGVQYDFRKTFITHALLAGINPVVVATMTGTSLKVIADHYLQLKPDDFTKEIGKLTL